MFLIPNGSAIRPETLSTRHRILKPATLSLSKSQFSSGNSQVADVRDAAGCRKTGTDRFRCKTSVDSFFPRNDELLFDVDFLAIEALHEL